MKKIYFCLVLLCCISGHSQAIFEKGYFINNAGLRTACYVEDSKNSPQELRYRLDPDSETLTKKIAEVQEFGIDSTKTYKRFKVK